MAKKRTTHWVIYEGGLRCGEAETKAKAESYINKMVKTLPLGMGYKFKAVEEPLPLR